MTASGTPPWRCADAARDRGDDLVGTAMPAARLLLVEVPGPWGRSALTESRLDHYVAGRLAERAGHAGVRVLLVRRPGRHPPQPPGAGPAAWALVDLRAGRQAVRWGTWTDTHALTSLDLRSDLPADPAAGPARSGPQRVALVCAHARHDVCCALRGRPVAAALAARTDWDVWECSHVGGDRFAANVLLVPSGELFGGLDPDSAVDVVRRFDGGRLALPHWRGRAGRSAVEQAALARAAAVLDDDRRGAVRVLAVEERPGEHWHVDVAHLDGAGVEQCYRLHLSTDVTRPHRLTCAAASPSRARVFTLDRDPEPLVLPPRG